MEQNERAEINMIVICHEVDKDTGQIAIYQVQGKLYYTILYSLKIRAMVNPELRKKE